jgi:hypothetical protein
MRTVAKIKVDFRTAQAIALGEAFTTEVAAELGDDVVRRAKEFTLPGVGPGPHPHKPPPAWQHVDTGHLSESIRADISKSANGVKMDVYSDLPYSLYLEAGWHGPSGRFYRYPWLRPSFEAALRNLDGIIRASAAIAFAGGVRGGLIGIRRGANPWQAPGWKKP